LKERRGEQENGGRKNPLRKKARRRTAAESREGANLRKREPHAVNYQPIVEALALKKKKTVLRK